MINRNTCSASLEAMIDGRFRFRYVNAKDRIFFYLLHVALRVCRFFRQSGMIWRTLGNCNQFGRQLVTCCARDRGRERAAAEETNRQKSLKKLMSCTAVQIERHGLNPPTNNHRKMAVDTLWQFIRAVCEQLPCDPTASANRCPK